MSSLRRYLTHWARMDAATVDRHLAAEAAGRPLPLPGLAAWAIGNIVLAEEGARLAAEIEAARAERKAAAADATPETAAAPAAPSEAARLVPSREAGFAADLRRSQITGSTPARSRQALAARLAADPTISAEDAIAALAAAPIEVSPEHGSNRAPDAGGFGSAAEAMPKTSAEANEEFRAIMQAAVDEQQARRLR